MIRKYLIVTGQVQGVGFRPFVYRWACECGLTGRVGNTPEGVRIEVQGQADDVRRFENGFSDRLPPLARVTGLLTGDTPVLTEEKTFEIVLSHEGEHQGHAVLVSPDMATCDACLTDMLNPADRRFGYSFTNCTDCGPRYSITRSIPYDRPVTSMACFPLCEDCAKEYGDPANRRFHAQPNACPICGPHVWLEDNGGESITMRNGRTNTGPGDSRDAILQALAELRRGRIAAIKGLGGFHLVCNALDTEALAALRLRKNRPHKALAVMVADIEHARLFAHISPEAEQALTAPERPIVICPRVPENAAPDGPPRLPATLSPDTGDIGLVLPYTPLHHLLFHPEALGAQKEEALLALVMTSGNAGGEPICLGNREAKARLADIADFFLLHNRDILVRVDDSVLFPAESSEAERPAVMLRRARGFTPSPQVLPNFDRNGAPAPSALLAAGSQMKHTFCLTRGPEAFVSQHIGELDRAGALEFFEETLGHLSGLLETAPQAVIRDAHPDYPSSRLAEEYGRKHGIPVLSLQHHFAHIYAVMAEHGLAEPVLGLALDGSGLGDDGTIWGGELLLATPGAPSPGARLGHLRRFRLPGGEAAIREPWRIAEALAANWPGTLRPWAVEPARAAMAEMIREMAIRGINSPLTSSCGRLFDAVAALCGICPETSYEGQAAIRLEQIQDFSAQRPYEFPLLQEGDKHAPLLVPDSLALFRQVAEDLAGGTSPGVAARRFHLTLAHGFAAWVDAAAETYGVRKVALGGGVFNNRTLTAELTRLLREKGLTPLTARAYPPGDGAISLGQACWAFSLTL